MEIFNKKLKAILLLIGIVALTIPTFATSLTANAGADQELNVTASNPTVTLNGTASTVDSNETIVLYEWFYNGESLGTGATIDVEPQASGYYTVTLTVTDNLGHMASDTVNVEVLLTYPTNIKADAGVDIYIPLTADNSTITLDGRASNPSTDGTIVKYEWFYNGDSLGTGETLDVEPSTSGYYSVMLVVTDSLGNTASDIVNIKVLATSTPIANAGTDINVTLTASNPTVTLDGTASTVESNGTIVTYEWFHNGASLGTGAILDVTPPASGTYVVTLTVTDSLGNTASDTVNVEVLLNGSSNLLTKEEPLVPVNCLGNITKSGIDTNGNGVLDEDEVTSTEEHYDEGTPITHEALMAMIGNGDDVTQVNTCKITDMSLLFSGFIGFNQDISGWNTGSVTNMNSMFEGTDVFNQSLDSWDVSNVTDMSGMFAHAQAFNKPLESWNVSSVTNMSSMFDGTEVFNQSLDSWDVSNVIDMSYMFSYSQAFNKPLESWNVSSVTNMNGMFIGTVIFNKPLDRWDVSKVINMSGMFAEETIFNQPLNNWDVSSVTDMSYMFSSATFFNQNIRNWDVSNVINHEFFAENPPLESAHNPFYEEVVTPISHLTRDNVKEIVIDSMSRLQWQDNIEAEGVYKTWQGAQDYCTNLRLGGYIDWVLPTIGAFESIDYSSFSDISLTPFVHYADDLYWTTDELANSSNGFLFYFYYGGKIDYPKSDLFPVRCVRGGQ